jgi:hypothetical protein
VRWACRANGLENGHAVLGFTVARGKIVEIDILADPDRLSQLNLAELEEG